MPAARSTCLTSETLWMGGDDSFVMLCTEECKSNSSSAVLVPGQQLVRCAVHALLAFAQALLFAIETIIVWCTAVCCCCLA